MSFGSVVQGNPLADSSGLRVAPPSILVVFGASGDLTSRKLMPAVERLAERQLLPAALSIVGVGRTVWTDEEFRERMRKAIAEDRRDQQAGRAWEGLIGAARYVAGGYDDPATYAQLHATLKELDEQRGTGGNRVYYLATPPSTFPDVVDQLARNDLNRPGSEGGFARVVIEKPYGRDLQSAWKLDACVHNAFDEDDVYRIDHYLGKETVQNLLALRFANAIFEPIWNRRYVDHVQVTVSESLGVEHRGSFYEQAGALRDIVQNHVMQVLSLTLMEPPASFDGQGIRDEKVKALRSVEVLSPDRVAGSVVRAQYTRGWVEGEEVPGYREEEGVDPFSTTETFMAMRMRVDNWRWAGVPIFVRTGKRMTKRLTEVALEFRRAPHLPFAESQATELGPNTLVLRIQPDEGITLRFGAKVPGQAFQVRSVSMDFLYGAAFVEETPEAYERLLLDALLGDPTLFIRGDEVEQAWRIVDPIMQAWSDDEAPLARYDAGTWGPDEANRLIESEGRRWRNP